MQCCSSGPWCECWDDKLVFRRKGGYGSPPSEVCDLCSKRELPFLHTLVWIWEIQDGKSVRIPALGCCSACARRELL